MAREYPTADSRRCYECSVLPGRDHHYDCQSLDAKRKRRAEAAEERRLMAELSTDDPAEITTTDCGDPATCAEPDCLSYRG